MSDNLNDDKWLDFVLICKPEQSGKTFVMIQEIIKDFSENNEDKKVINFILCDNNLLLTKQTSTRVNDDLEEYKVGNEIYLELSSHKRTKYHEHGTVFHAIITKGIHNIICCTNGKRMDDIYQLIKDFNLSPLTKDKFCFKIWLDEADKFTKFIDGTLFPAVNNFDNIKVFCITATPQSLFNKYKYMNVYPIEKTTGPKYHGWNDNIVKIVDLKVNYLEFIKHVLINIAKENIIPGSKWFIPGLIYKRSHLAIKDFCTDIGMAVITVNGGFSAEYDERGFRHFPHGKSKNGIILTLPNKLRYEFSKDDNFNVKLIDIYVKHNLQRYPLVITGNVCIGRGITINTDEEYVFEPGSKYIKLGNDGSPIIRPSFIIDYAILSNTGNKSEASQIAGRLKGNMKDFIGYKRPVVYTTEKFDAIAKEWEKKSTHLAEIAFIKDKNGELPIINKQEFRTCGENYEYIIHKELLPSYTKAMDFLLTKSLDMKQRPRGTKNTNALHKINDYIVTSKLLTAGKTVQDLKAEDRLTLDKANEIPAGRCISSTNKGSRFLILPVYENMDSPPKSVKFQVRYIKFTS